MFCYQCEQTIEGGCDKKIGVCGKNEDIAILLGLFSLGVKNIYLGPKPPEFVTPNVFKVLQDNFNLKLTGDATNDMRVMLG